jgi:hypothetical protein
MNMTTIGRPPSLRREVVSKPDAAIEVVVFHVPENIVRKESVKVVRTRINFWNLLKKLFKREGKKLRAPHILSVELCADHGLAQVIWNVAGSLQPCISFVGPDGPFQSAGTLHPANLHEATSVPLFYNYPNQTTAWVKVLGIKGSQSVFSEPVAAYVDLC